MLQENWDKELIYTLMGYYQKDNTFIDINKKSFKCITYREFNRELNPEQLCCVNMKWSEALKDWVIFQVVLLNNDIE